MTKTTKVTKLKTKATGKAGKSPILATEAARILGCSMALMYMMKRDGRLKTGFVKGKRLYFESDEIDKLNKSGDVHPRQKRQVLGVGDLVDTYQKEAKIEVIVPADQYNMLSMMLASQKMSVADYCAKAVANAVAEVQQAMNKTAAAGGSR